MVQSAYLQVCLIVFGILIFASLANFGLRRWRPQNVTFQKVEVIVKSWWLIASAILLAMAWSQWGILLLTYAISIFSVREYLKVSRVPYKNYLFGSLVCLCTIQYICIALGSLYWFLAFVPVTCLWFVSGLVIVEATIDEIELISAVGFGWALLIYYFGHIAGLSNFNELDLSPEQALFATLLLFLVTWSNDVFQFISGKSFGRRKIVSKVSPNKTLGGFIGGAICTSLLAAIFFPWLLGLSLQNSIVLGLLMSLTGMLGDLFFSAIKRRMGVKDFSEAIPGHGGLLDRMDSLIFTAPVFFHFLLLIKKAV